VGLDTDIKKIPPHLLKTEDPVFEFNKSIIDATSDLCVAYKPNWAFYEAMGIAGMISLHKTLHYIPSDCLIIADAKRGDIDSTAQKYAEAFYHFWHADSVTLSPYIGKDSVLPYLNYEGKYAILLGLTSNAGAADLQLKTLSSGQYLFEETIAQSKSWGNKNNMMYVVGATKVDYMQRIRKLIPEHFWLVPCIGAQGGNVEEVIRYGCTDEIGLIINNTRGIIYPSVGKDFAHLARTEAGYWKSLMEDVIRDRMGD